MNNRFALALILVVTLLTACKAHRSDQSGAIDTTSLPKGADIDEDAVRSLVVNGHKLYASIDAMATSEHRDVAGKRLVLIDPAKWGSMKAFRAKLGAVFTGAAIDSIIHDRGIREEDGKAWMIAGDDESISNYDDADVVDVEKDSSGIVADVEIPLGDSGQSDDVTVLVRRTPNGWKIANNIFNTANIDADDGDESDTTDQ
jgi:hypothetical protein